MNKVVGKVIESNQKIEGSSVELSDGSITLRGRVAAVSVNEFLVEWEDGVHSVENKSDYELVVEAHEKTSSLPSYTAQYMGLGIMNPVGLRGAPMVRVRDNSPAMIMPPVMPASSGVGLSMPPAGVGGAWDAARNNINNAWTNVQNGAGNTWRNIVNRLDTAWRSVERGLTKKREKGLTSAPAAPKPNTSANPGVSTGLEMPAPPATAIQAPAYSGKP